MAKNFIKSSPEVLRKGIRTVDDLELIKLVLEENPRLKMKVMKIIEDDYGMWADHSVKNKKN